MLRRGSFLLLNLRQVEDARGHSTHVEVCLATKWKPGQQRPREGQRDTNVKLRAGANLATLKIDRESLSIATSLTCLLASA